MVRPLTPIPPPSSGPADTGAYPSRVRVRRGIALALVAAVAVAGCGTTSTERKDEQQAVTADELIADFGAEPGKPKLKPAPAPDRKFEQLGIGLDPPPELLRRYGVFSIYVVRPGEDQAKQALLTDKTTGAPLERDERGIYWEYDDQSRTWIANSVYGENVVLVWFSEKRKRVTDARWERLDRFLTESTLS